MRACDAGVLTLQGFLCVDLAYCKWHSLSDSQLWHSSWQPTGLLAEHSRSCTLLQITEDLALRFGQTIGGLLNATFGKLPLVDQKTALLP